MPGSVRFRYDAVHDIHYAYPKWLIETEEDCKVWQAQFVEHFSKFKSKVDVVFVLDDFKIGPKIGPIWGRYRADWVSKYTRYTVRVNVDARVASFNSTSAAIYGASYEIARDVESAIGFILARRRADGVE